MAIDLCNETQKISFSQNKISAVDTVVSAVKNPKYFSMKKIRDFIKSQPNYRHSIPILSQHFYGRVVSSDIKNKEDRRIYDNLWSKARRIRKQIEKKEKGKWEVIKEEDNGFGKPVTYKFIKNDV